MGAGAFFRPKDRAVFSESSRMILLSVLPTLLLLGGSSPMLSLGMAVQIRGNLSQVDAGSIHPT